MLKAPRPGLVKTRLAADVGAEAALQIYKQLAEHQVRQFPPGWPSEIHFTPADALEEMHAWLGAGHQYIAQGEGNLGERLLRAAGNRDAECGKGIIFLGADCPGVTDALLRECSAQLQHHDAVIGPARDGGYYLLAIKKLEPRIFEEIDWSTDRVLEQTLSRLREMQWSHSMLPEQEDVDDAGSWERSRALLDQGPAAT